MGSCETESDTYVHWPYFAKWAKEIKEFEVRDSDVIVAGPPKTGTTWMQEMVWIIANNFDFEGAKTEFSIRFPLLDYCAILEDDAAKGPNALPDFLVDSLNYISKQESPRFYKTHLPFFLLPEQIQNYTKKPKIIAMARNAKDTCISYYHFLKGAEPNSNKDLEGFCKEFLAGKSYNGNVSYWNFVLSYWEQRNSDNILFVRYEEMKENLRSVMERVATFLEKNITEEQLAILERHLSFEQMKTNTATNFEQMFDRLFKARHTERNVVFMRSGTVGSYKKEIPSNLVQEFDEWTKRNLEGTGLDY